MPETRTLKRAAQDKKVGKAPSTQAGEFVREEIDHIREGKHGARNTNQAIAIGLSKARRAGVNLPLPKPGRASEATRKQAARDTAKAKSGSKSKPNYTRSRAATKALKKEGRAAVSKSALSKQAHQAAKKGAQTRSKPKASAPRKVISKKTANAKRASKSTARSSATARQSTTAAQRKR